jgi:transposase InsO family protein
VGGKKDAPPVSRRAEQPGQTLNVDLCFVPATHEVSAKLPAVSGSSGRLIVERPPSEDNIGAWPGRIFENPDLPYEGAMLAFVATAQERASQPTGLADAAANGSLAAEKRILGRTEAQLRDARRQVRAQRQLEDAAWQATRGAHRAAAQADQVRPKAARLAKTARTAQWRALRDQRRATLAARQPDDAAWRQARLELRQRWSALPVISAWIAILVIVDNCTRQCLGLPLFVAGPKVTAEMIVEALAVLLPPELQFLITDRGTHFTANAFKTLVLSEAFIHVLIARHRPQSNGIAERFVRTLKEWLADKAWLDDQELATLLQQFQAEYGDRPHQGLAMPGLSPNEFAQRIWLM